jgi:serine/tyrosine/threonine adenylyltransferase
MSRSSGQVFDALSQSYRSLPSVFFRELDPSPVRAPKLRILNRPLAHKLGLDADALAAPENVQILAGNVFPESIPAIAQAYAGHQFGGFTQLGDGRALLLGELTTPAGQLVDIQLKGSGPTPYARRGDGRAALGPMLREYLISEAMHGLGIPTTRSLAVVTTGEPVFRESVLPGAVLTRVAASHIRVGTFEFAATHGYDELKALADYTIDRHDPQVRDSANPYLALLNAVIDRQAALIARWMAVGFVHGVMNTDNMSIAGETIDYGPCAFMDRYDPSTVFSSIDRQGRYAYANQPRIAHWNLSRLAEAMLPLLHADETTALNLAQNAIGEYPGLYQTYWHRALCQKIGVANPDNQAVRLAGDLLDLMWHSGADFTNTFTQLSHNDLNDPAFTEWLSQWHDKVATQPGGMAEARQLMQQVNPVVIPRNQLVQAALDEAEEEKGSFAPFEQLLAVIQSPFDSKYMNSAYAQTPAAGTRPYVTYCGT